MAPKVAIACQGGGSHAAFAAGVLLELLSQDNRSRFELAGISGTSGGAICAALAWYSYVMLNVDYASAAPSSAFASLPAWIPETILPTAFGLMALRFVLRAFLPPAHTPPLLHPIEPTP